MDIWDSYEALPPMQRLIINFTVGTIFVIAVFRIDKWAKNRQWVSYGDSGTKTERQPSLYSNLEQKTDGTLIAYIAFWRYIIFGLLYAAAIYISGKGFIYLYQELPTGFWKHWDKNATLTLITLIISVAMLIMGYQLLKGGYKKVQFELTKYNVRYLKSAIRGGILLSDNYISVPIQSITDVELGQNPLGGGVITAYTTAQTHSMLLLLSPDELLVCYHALQEAIKNTKIDRS